MPFVSTDEYFNRAATEEDVIAMMEADLGRELTEQEQNVAVAQAEIIGDL